MRLSSHLAQIKLNLCLDLRLNLVTQGDIYERLKSSSKKFLGIAGPALTKLILRKNIFLTAQRSQARHQW